MKFRVVIVTYNSAQTIERCLESLGLALAGLEATVVIVDNASTDGTIAKVDSYKLQATSYKLTLVRNERNEGFARAVNQGVAELSRHGGTTVKRDPSTRDDNSEALRLGSGNNVILLLNPDTEIEGDVIGRTIEWMQAHPKVGVAGPVMLNADGSVQPSVRRFPTFWTIVGMALKLHKVFPHWRVFRRYFDGEQGSTFSSSRSNLTGGQLPITNYQLPTSVDQVMGAAFFINGKCWKELGGMDERFFLWFEEVDFCKRAKNAGWEVMRLPFQAIRHLGAVSFHSRARLKNQIQFFLSAWQYLNKHAPVEPFGIDRRLIAITVSLATIVELFSFWAHQNPVVGIAGFVAVLIAVLALSMRQMLWGVSFVLAELAMGSKGYLLSASLWGTAVSLRMGLFAVVFSCWLARCILERRSQMGAFLKTFPLLGFGYALLFLSVLWGGVRGLLVGRDIGALFLDGNAWAFLLLLPVFLDGVKTRSDFGKLMSVFLGAAMVFGLKTLLLLYIFTHDFEFLFIPTVYRWVRDTGVAEVTQLGANLWRVFAQSHLFSVLALFLWLAVRASGHRGFISFFGAAVAVSVLLISLSRSFWFGIVAAMIISIVIFSRSGVVRALSWRNVFDFAAVVIVGVLLLFAVVRFPYPKSPTTFSVQIFSQRLASLGTEPAARSRWQLLPPLLREIRRAPFLGSGFGTMVEYASLDPRALSSSGPRYRTYAFEWGYLDLWLKMGFGGLLAFAFVLLGFIQNFKRIVASSFSRQWSFVSFGIFLAIMTTFFTHVFSPYLNHPLGLGMLLFATSFIFMLKYEHSG